MKPQRGRFGIQSSKTLKCNQWFRKEKELIQIEKFNIQYSLNKKQRWTLKELVFENKFGIVTTFPIVKWRSRNCRTQIVKCSFHSGKSFNLPCKVARFQFAYYEASKKLQKLTYCSRQYGWKYNGKNQNAKSMLKDKRQLLAIALLD